MKALLTSLILVVVSTAATAQWLGTNPVHFNGNVGIGTTNPAIWFGGKTLELSDTRPVLKLNSTSSLSTITLTNSGVNGTTHIGEFHVNHEYNSGTPNLSSMRFASYPAGDILIMKATGEVGVGTSSTTAKLTVKGDVHAREVRVTVDAGADFVFEDNYNLPKLDAVEKFIEQHNHLPGVAPASEMKSNGMDVGEMNIKLLQKVEELTLYMIEFKKQMAELKMENEELKQAINKR